LTNHPGSDVAAVWSPDNAQLAFVSRRQGNTEIYVMNSDGSEQVNLTNNPARDFAPAWRP
jgi:TolB protein